jgi:hypothetical protein
MYRKKGIYVLRFFKDFRWRYVILDNRLPCFENNQLIFGKCKSENELWVPLIEKAYAKLHGCYQSLISGFLDDALTDLTGLVSEKVKVQDNKGCFNMKALGDPDEFWATLMARRAEKCMMGCSAVGDTEGELLIDGEKTGILKGHAYGVIDVFTLANPTMAVKKGRDYHRLLRIRNPWGKLEWQGKWSDCSEQVEEHEELLQGYIDSLDEDDKFVLGEDDGTFLMCYSDFRNIFQNLFISVDFPVEWTGVRFQSCWDNTCSGGTPSPFKEPMLTQWASNPQYLLEIKKVASAEVFISLAQPDGRARGSDGAYESFPFEGRIHPVCFCVMRPGTDEKMMAKFEKSKVHKVSVLKEHREVSLRMKLKKGRYIIVPSTRSPG